MGGGGGESAPGTGSGLSNAVEIITKLAGAGISSAGGSLGPVLFGIGQTLEGRRMRERDQAVNSALLQLIAPAQGSMTLPGTPTVRPGALSLAENPEAAGITPGEGGAPGAVGRAPETRTFDREPTRTELLSRLVNLNVAEPVRGDVINRALGLRLPDEGRVPPDLERERRVRAIEGGYATAFPGVNARTYAEATEAGARLPQPYTAEEQKTRSARETLQQEIGAGKYDLNTAAGVQGLQRRAAELGVPDEADRYVRQVSQRREIATAEREENIRTKLVPQWRKHIEDPAFAKSMPGHVLEGVRVAIDAAEADPSPANVRGVTAAFQAASKSAQTSEQFQRRLASIDARAKAARDQRDQTTQVRVLGQLANELEREISIRQRDAYNAPDPVTRANAALQVEELTRRLQQIEGMQFSRVNTPPAAGGGATPAAPPAAPPAAAPGAGGSGVDELRRKGLLR